MHGWLHNSRPTCRNRGLPGGNLVPHLMDDFRGGSDEPDSGVDDRLSEVRPLRQEAVTWMDGVDAVVFAYLDDFGDVEVGLHRSQALSDQVTLIGFESVDVGPVFFGVDRHRFYSQFCARSEDSHSDLASVGHQDAPDRFVLDFR
jgi:hypothetical protein